MLLDSPQTLPIVSSEMLLDGTTPVAAYNAVRRLAEGPSFLLESAPGAGQLARFSVIGLGSIAQFCASSNGNTAAFPDGRLRQDRDDVLTAARAFVTECRSICRDAAASPYAGAYAVASFGCAALFEPHLAACYPDASLRMIVPAALIVVDHASHVAQLMVLGEGDALHARIERALESAHLVPLSIDAATCSAQRRMPAEHFCESVACAQEAINDGELFQIVLSQAWEAPLPYDPLDAYRRLRSINPSPYMFYFDSGDGVLFGSSPEMLCKLEGTLVRLRPLAGTRSRPKDKEAERQAERELRCDPKERAEHVMLVDLGRNDVGRVSRYGSVEVSELMAVERYSHVMHLVSEVQGRIAPGCDAFDLFASAFPAGTVSGAPKIRALEFIAQLEAKSRGFYGGSVARFGFDGSLDACIVLRSAEVRDGVATFCAGAGIVADSVPQREDAECCAKAMAIARTLGADVS